MDVKRDIEEVQEKIAAENVEIAKSRTHIRELTEELDQLRLEDARLERERIHQENLERGRIWQEANPEEHAAFMEAARIRNQQDVIEGFLDGWWDLDDDGNMAAPAQVFHLSDFAEVNNPLMAHVMAKAGIFPSVGQARKNGWNKPLTTGSWSVTKKKIRIRVEE